MKYGPLPQKGGPLPGIIECFGGAVSPACQIERVVGPAYKPEREGAVRHGHQARPFGLRRARPVRRAEDTERIEVVEGSPQIPLDENRDRLEIPSERAKRVRNKIEQRCGGARML